MFLWVWGEIAITWNKLNMRSKIQKGSWNSRQKKQKKTENIFPFPVRGSQLEKPGCHPESEAHTAILDQNRERESHCLYPLSPVFLWLLRTVSKWSRWWGQSKNLLSPLSSLFWFWFPVRARFGFWISVELTLALDNILSHWAQRPWHSSVLIEIKPKCNCVAWYVVSEGQADAKDDFFLLLFDVFGLGGVFSKKN